MRPGCVNAFLDSTLPWHVQPLNPSRRPQTKLFVLSDPPIAQVFSDERPAAGTGGTGEISAHQRAMMDDLGLSADIVGASSIFTGDEEVFAFARAVVSRVSVSKTDGPSQAARPGRIPLTPLAPHDAHPSRSPASRRWARCSGRGRRASQRARRDSRRSRSRPRGSWRRHRCLALVRAGGSGVCAGTGLCVPAARARKCPREPRERERVR